MSYEEIYLWLYVGLSIVLTSFSALVVYWAIKNKQFSNSSHANILPLISGIPDEEKKGKGDGVTGERGKSVSV